jgi:peptide-methionine (S)-S-oxide reductase
VIYVYDQQQLQVAKKVKQELQELINKGVITEYSGRTVSTSIRKATKFFAAQDDHQDYLNVNPGGYCNHRLRFRKWPSS